MRRTTLRVVFRVVAPTAEVAASMVTSVAAWIDDGVLLRVIYLHLFVHLFISVSFISVSFFYKCVFL